MAGEKPVRAGSEPGQLGQTRRKLIDFLQTSHFYEPERLLAHFSGDCKYSSYINFDDFLSVIGVK